MHTADATPTRPTSEPRRRLWLVCAWVLSCALALPACAPAPQSIEVNEATVGDAPPPPAQASPSTALPARGTSANYSEREDAKAWADGVAARTDLPLDWVHSQIAQAQRQAEVIRAVTPAPTSAEKNWVAYRARFVEPVRIQAGLAFWQRHAATLARAEQQFGVPASMIVGVIGVETLYGRHLGNHRVIDALATLAFDFPVAHPREPVRSAMFQQELLELLLLSREQNLDPQTLRGSFAGAMGWPQFMPSSWRRYAVDFDRDGRIDLLNNPVDVIGSVANYFVAFGWQRDLPTHYPVRIAPNPTDLPGLLAPDIVPSFDVNTFTAKGAVLDPTGLKHTGLLALVRLENGKGAPSHVAGTHNFYVVTRYNWSSYYALAVIDLAAAVAREMQKQAK
jgi:membrane-bound lytic murein transglycosylase B